MSGIWILAQRAIDIIANRRNMTTPDACLELQWLLRDGVVSARGPLEGLQVTEVGKEFWTYASPDVGGQALNLSTLRRLPWFEILAPELHKWLSEIDWVAEMEKPSEAVNETPKSASPSAVTVGASAGRPRKWDWEGAIMEMGAKTYAEGIPETQAEMERHLKDWFVKQRGNHPAESEIKARVSEFYRKIKEALAGRK